MLDETIGTPQKVDPPTVKETINQKGNKPPKHCAHSLEPPTLPRELNTFCGLRNQGATCYLNALIQLYYMSPELRNMVLLLPLCKDSIENPTEFVPSNSAKYKILLALQKLFSQMQELNVNALTTEQVTESFGWNNNQAQIQQDIQEANRVMLDVLERALAGTDFAESIQKYYKGTSVTQVECLRCGAIKEREESFYDLILLVKGFSSLAESLLSLLDPEKLNGSNQYFCEACDKKVDAQKSFKIRKFPPILTLSLNRFEYDCKKNEMKKVNDELRFGLELDISMFAEDPALYPTQEESMYELAGVLIHNGDPYSGHYHAYIRDQLKEGDWEKKFQEIRKQKLEKEGKTADPTKLEENGEPKKEENEEAKQNEKTEEEKKGIEDASTDEEENAAQAQIIEGLKPDEEPAKPHHQPPGKNKKKNKGGKGAKGNKKRRRNQYVSQTSRPSQKEKSEEKKAEVFDESVKDDVEFPIPFENKELGSHWFDFNDSAVTAIPANRIQVQFGGGANENAYILLYRQRKLVKDPHLKTLKVQDYLQQNINTQHEVLESLRTEYKKAESEMELIVLTPELINFSNLKFVDQMKPAEIGNKIRVAFADKFEEAFKGLKLENPADYTLVEVKTLGNGLIQFKRSLDFSFGEIIFSDLYVEHLSVWALFKTTDQIYLETVSPFCGSEFIPIRVNLRDSQSANTQLITYKNLQLQDFQKQIEKTMQIPVENQLLFLLEGEEPNVLNSGSEDNTKRLSDLGISDSADILITQLDPEEVKKRQEEASKNGKQNGGNKNVEAHSNGNSENNSYVQVERDDEEGSIKYYVDLDWTLEGLIDNLKRKLNIEPSSERRLRKKASDTLFNEVELSLKLRFLGFEKSGMQLKLERGKTPLPENLVLLITSKSSNQKEKKTEHLSVNVLPKESILDLKKRACKELELNPNVYKLYQTDMFGEPVQAFNNESNLLKDTTLKNGDVLVLLSQNDPISKDILKVNIHVTTTGFADDSHFLGCLQVRESHTLLELKNLMFLMPYFSATSGIADCLRLREVKKDMFFGKVYKGNNKTLKQLGFEANTSIVAQVLDHPEDLDDNALLFSLKRRLVDYQLYTKNEEWIWHAPEIPTIDDLKRAVIEHKQLDIGLDGIELAVYITHEFQWLPFTRKRIEEHWQANRKKNKNKKRRNIQLEEVENLRKGPFYLEDGDIIGYRLEAENPFKNDDFETLEDEENRRRFLEDGGESTTSDNKRTGNAGGFQIYTDF